MTTCVTSNCTVNEALGKFFSTTSRSKEPRSYLLVQVTRNLSAAACNEPIRDRSAQCAAAATSLIIVSAVIVALRFGYKYWASADYWFDDWFALLTLLTATPVTVLIVRGMLANGLGRDIWTLPLEKIPTIGRHFYVSTILYYAEITFIKLAILFFYLRIFPPTGVRRVLCISIVLVGMYGIAFIVVGIFICRPISYFWWKWDGEHRGTCMNRDAVACANAAISVALDLWILAIPLWKLKSLRLNWRKKAAVTIMFCVGTL